MWSDLDYVIVNENDNNNNNEINYNFLGLLYEKISKQNWIKKIKFISSAKIPIIKVVTTEKYNKIPIDISMENSGHFGLKSVELVKEYLNKYESLEPIVFAIKTLLKLSNLNDPYSGGISSYGIILMIVNFLINQNNKGEKISIDNIGSLFYEFLFFYGSRIDTNFINVTSEEIPFGFENLSPFQLYIVDPLNLNNNVGKSTYHYFNIKTMFLLALQSLKEECFCDCHYNINPNNNNNKIENYYNHNCLKKMFNAVRRIALNYNIGF
jgi:non-canonical poly(A) RNA polymerase PAPD5/7